MGENRYRKIVSRSLNIAVGSRLAIFVAYVLKPQNATAAGIITLITIVMSRQETVQAVVSAGDDFFSACSTCPRDLSGSSVGVGGLRDLYFCNGSHLPALKLGLNHIFKCGHRDSFSCKSEFFNCIYIK